MPEFRPSGLLAVDPRAIGQVYGSAEVATLNVEGVAIVKVRGPLSHHDEGSGWDSYDGLTGRVAAALADSAIKAVVLQIDSPGGFVSGCFDCAQTLRAMAEGAKKPLYAFVDGQACSAAYALACAAEGIYVSQTASLGSIGVVECLLDATASDALAGFRYELVTSGARKADGNPHSKLTDAALSVSRANVEYLAGIFFDLVASRRSGLTGAKLKALEAATFTGALAVRARLADRVSTIDDVVAALILGQALPGANPAEVAAELETKERARLLASRPDLNRTQRAALSQVPHAQLRSVLAAIPDASGTAACDRAAARRFLKDNDFRADAAAVETYLKHNCVFSA